MMTTIYADFLERIASRLVRKPSHAFPNAGQIQKRLFFALLLFRPKIRLLLVLVGVSFATIGLVVPVTQKQAIDALTSATEGAVFGKAAWLFVAGFLALLMTRGLEVLVRAIGLRESVLVENWLSNELYQKALSLQYEQRAHMSVGETVALMASHLGMVSFFLADLFPAFFTSFIPILMAPLVLTFFFDLSPLPVFAVVFSVMTMFGLFARRASHLYQHYKKVDDIRLGSLNEWIQNLKSLRVLGWTDSFEDKLASHTHRAMAERVRVVGWSQFMNSTADAVPMILNITAVLTLLYTRPQPPTPGDVFGILWVMTVFLIIPLRILPWVFVVAIDAALSLDRVHRFLKLPNQEPFASAVGPSEGLGDANSLVQSSDIAIAVRGLSLDLSGMAILRDISFSINAGEFVAIVGDVGAGKTQLFHALLGETPAVYQDFQLFGQPVTGMAVAELHSYFAIAPQDAFTMAASVHENVRLDYDPQPVDEVLGAILRSLDLVAYGPDLALLSDGIYTELGERGVNLSGGQRQRLGLARAHYSARRILLLDDALSALDAETERRVIEQLMLKEWQNVTRLLITHRLSVLPSVDRILFLRAGRLVAEGPYQKLIKRSDFQDFVRTLRESGANED